MCIACIATYVLLVSIEVCITYVHQSEILFAKINYLIGDDVKYIIQTAGFVLGCVCVCVCAHVYVCVRVWIG